MTSINKDNKMSEKDKNWIGGLEYLIKAMTVKCESQEEAKEVFILTYHFIKEILNEHNNGNKKTTKGSKARRVS